VVNVAVVVIADIIVVDWAGDDGRYRRCYEQSEKICGEMAEEVHDFLSYWGGLALEVKR